MGGRGPEGQNARVSRRNQVNKTRACGVLAGLVLVGVALAHSNLTRSTPADAQTIPVLPKTVVLEFSEPLELKFSSFKIYKISTKATDVKTARTDADALMDTVLEKKSDEATRADDGLLTNVPTAARLEVKLKPNLTPGWYVVMWKVLSVDTHTSDDSIVFRYKPN
jgi:copper resistance protein C